MTFSFVLLLVALAGGCGADFGCVYRAPGPKEILTGVVLEPLKTARSRRSTTSSHQLNIQPFYASSFDSEHNAAELKAKIVEPAIEYWESVLRVKTVPSIIRLSRYCNSANVTYHPQESSSEPPQYYCKDGCSSRHICGHTEIPADHLGKCREVKSGAPTSTGPEGAGVRADFILYISAYKSASCESSILGYAAHCQQEVTLDRPIAGYINFCPGKLSTALGSLQQSLFTAQHEILHALGFAISLYAYFRDQKGDPLTPRAQTSNTPALGMRPGTFIYNWSTNVTINRTLTWETRTGSFAKPVTLLVLPNVLREAREHFNCPTMEGVELEDQGEDGVRLTHWEKRLLENELMTATYTHEHVISRMTLAFMQDTGWYDVDYTNAQPLAWGKGLGCAFVSKSCMSWMRAHPHSPSPYCTDIGKSGSSISTTDCTVGRRSVGYCILEKYPRALPPLYQYFTSLRGVPSSQVQYYAGGVLLADYCPFVQGFNWKSGNKPTRTTDCKNSLNNAALLKMNSGLQSHGASSACFLTDDKWRVDWCNKYSNLSTLGSGCYKFQCHVLYGLILSLNGRSYQCLSEGQTILISESSRHALHQGGVVCPKCSDVCGQSKCPASPAKLRKPHPSYAVPCVSSHSVVHPSLALLISLAVVGLLDLDAV